MVASYASVHHEPLHCKNINSIQTSYEKSGHAIHIENVILTCALAPFEWRQAMASLSC